MLRLCSDVICKLVRGHVFFFEFADHLPVPVTNADDFLHLFIGQICISPKVLNQCAPCGSDAIQSHAEAIQLILSCDFAEVGRLDLFSAQGAVSKFIHPTAHFCSPFSQSFSFAMQEGQRKNGSFE